MKIEFKTNQGEFAFIKCFDLCFYTDHTNEGICYVEHEDNRVIKVDTGNRKVEWSAFVKDITEEQWNEVIDWMPHRHSNYKIYFDYIKKYYWYGSATSSGKSLMDSLELKEGNWLLIKYL